MNTMLNMPRQAPGILRGAAGSAALRGAAGVEASGFLEWLLGDDLGGTVGDLVDTFVPGGAPLHHLADQIYGAV